MILFSNRVIPLDRALTGSPLDVAELWIKMREHPVQFVMEAIALGLMIVGLMTALGPIYNTAKALGERLVTLA